MNLCDIETIRAVLGRHGFHFSKSLGQNFLTDESVPRRIAEMSGAAECGNAIEVGPGMGCLSAELCRRADKVVAVELDRALMPVLAETLADYDNFEVVHGDVLETDLAALCKEKFGDGKAIACANLPYYITTPAITALLESGAFEQVTVMVQKEVAQRICAPAGKGDYGAFSVFCQYYAEPELLFDVPASCFMCSTTPRRKFCLMFRRTALCPDPRWIRRCSSSCRSTSRRLRPRTKSCSFPSCAQPSICAVRRS